MPTSDIALRSPCYKAILTVKLFVAERSIKKCSGKALTSEKIIFRKFREKLDNGIECYIIAYM